MSLTSFFQYALDNCQYRNCFLELNLIGTLDLADGHPTTPHPGGLTAPYLEYQIEIGKSGGTASGATLEASDTRPVITSTGELPAAPDRGFGRFAHQPTQSVGLEGFQGRLRGSAR